MPILVLKLFGVAAALVLAAFLVAQALRNARRLDRRIDEVRAEEEADRQAGRVRNPWAEFAALFAPKDPPHAPRGRKGTPR